MDNFAITGMGRSGTKFLAGLLNRAVGWTVEHEPHPGFQSLQEVVKRFDKSNYGEVNSYLRYQILSIPVSFRAVILRDPRDIFHSMYNRGKPDLERLNEVLVSLDSTLSSGKVSIISFSKMTSDRDYLKSLIDDIGLKIELPLDLSRVNASNRKVMSTSLNIKSGKKLSWFVRAYKELF